MSEETTTDRLAEIEGQAEDTPATEYTPPEGWRLVRFGELLLPGDEIVQIDDGRRYPTHRIGDAVGPNQQYIRRIKPQPQPEPQLTPDDRAGRGGGMFCRTNCCSRAIWCSSTSGGLRSCDTTAGKRYEMLMLANRRHVICSTADASNNSSQNHRFRGSKASGRANDETLRVPRRSLRGLHDSGNAAVLLGVSVAVQVDHPERGSDDSFCRNAKLLHDSTICNDEG